MLMTAVKPDIPPHTCCTLTPHDGDKRLRYSSSRFRGLLDEELACTPTALWYFYTVRRGPPSDTLATLVVTLLCESTRQKWASRDAVCYNLLCRCAWLVPLYLRWPSRPHAALFAFFIQYIPPRVVVTRVGLGQLCFPLLFSFIRISMPSFHFDGLNDYNVPSCLFFKSASSFSRRKFLASYLIETRKANYSIYIYIYI